MWPPPPQVGETHKIKALHQSCGDMRQQNEGPESDGVCFLNEGTEEIVASPEVWGSAGEPWDSRAPKEDSRCRAQAGGRAEQPRSKCDLPEATAFPQPRHAESWEE